MHGAVHDPINVTPKSSKQQKKTDGGARGFEIIHSSPRGACSDSKPAKEGQSEEEKDDFGAK